MLTSDLVLARVYKKKVRPRYVSDRDPELLEMAGQLIEIFEAHRGRSRQALDAELAELLGTGTDFQLHRGLAKLLQDRCEFEADSRIDPERIRESVFRQSAELYQRAGPPQDDASPFSFDRADALERAAAELELAVEEVERGLYADLKTEQVLQEFKTCTPQWLLRRYSVALAQGVLLRATRLEIEIAGSTPARQRALFRKIKFFQLMHRVSRSKEGGWRVILDGPVSLFKASGKYGLQMASFLPTLLHFEDWSLEAEVQWGAKRRALRFELEAADGLRSHTRLTGQWQPEEWAGFAERFADLGSEWSVREGEGDLIDLGGRGVLVPDYVFEHRPSGLEVPMEIFGFWRKGAVDSRLELVRRHGPKRLVLALSSRLAAGREGLGEVPAEIYLFRSQPVPRKLLKVLATFL
ncbi:MAG: DUF790 family protein [Acidobacteriota bacterium]